MSYESSAEPIKVGYLMDFLLSDDFPQIRRGTIPQTSAEDMPGQGVGQIQRRQ